MLGSRSWLKGRLMISSTHVRYVDSRLHACACAHHHGPAPRSSHTYDCKLRVVHRTARSRCCFLSALSHHRTHGERCRPIPVTAGVPQRRPRLETGSSGSRALARFGALSGGSRQGRVGRFGTLSSHFTDEEGRECRPVALGKNCSEHAVNCPCSAFDVVSKRLVSGGCWCFSWLVSRETPTWLQRPRAYLSSLTSIDVV